jgi:hypothetical protein
MDWQMALHVCGATSPFNAGGTAFVRSKSAGVNITTGILRREGSSINQIQF